MNTMSDLSAVIQIREGNIKAFEKLFRQYYAPLCRYAASLTRDMEVSEEIVQELFYKLWKERANFHIFFSLKAYLYRSVLNNALQYLDHVNVKNRYREKAIREFDEEHFNGTPLDELRYAELQRQISEVLNTLPERRRQIFRLHRFEGKKYTEIAQLLSISVKTEQAEMSKALQILKKQIEA